MLWAASMTAFMPDAQTLFTVVQITEYGRPAPKAACLAGAWQRPPLFFRFPFKGKQPYETVHRIMTGFARERAHLPKACADNIAHENFLH
jgi:hypothetical protein